MSCCCESGCCCCRCCCCNKVDESLAENVPFDPKMRRRCRDVFWLLLFSAFVAGLVVIAGFAIKEGDFHRFNHGTDMYGAVCGFDTTINGTRYDHRQKKYLLWADVTDLDVQLCVEKCPNSTLTVSELWEIFRSNYDPFTSYVDASSAYSKLTCYYGMNASLDAVTSDDCWPNYPSTSLLGRCVPDVSNADLVDEVLNLFFNNATLSKNETIDWSNPVSILTAAEGVISNLNARQVFMRVLSDVKNSWHIILIMGCASFGVGFLWLIVLRVFAGVVVWSGVLAALGGLFGLTIYIWVMSRKAASNLVGTSNSLTLNDDKVMAEVLSYAVNALLIIDTIAVFLVLLVRKRIRLAVAIVKEASIAVRNLPCLVMGVPPWFFLSISAFMAYWIIIGLLLATAGLKDTLETKSIASIPLPTRVLRYFAIYHLFGLYWCLEFISAVARLTITGSIAEWYWRRGNTAQCSAAASFFRTCRYYLGCAAFGSLIVAIVSMMRSALEWYDAHRKKKLAKLTPAAAAAAMEAAFCVVRCCLWCFEKCIRFLTKNAYVIVAITGKSFCASGREAMEIIVKNPIRITILNIVAGFFLLLTRIAISSITALIAAAILHQDDDLKYWYVPVAIVFVIAFFVSSVFTVIYDMAIKTILYSFCHDESILTEAHSNRLREFMSSKKKKADKAARMSAMDVDPNSDEEREKEKEDKRDKIELHNRKSSPPQPQDMHGSDVPRN